MDWRLQPLIPILILATLALLAIPRAAHPQSRELIAACQGDALTLCPVEVGQAMLGARKPIGRCMRAHWNDLSAPCRAAVHAERKAGRL
jgi:hypothetical protein